MLFALIFPGFAYWTYEPVFGRSSTGLPLAELFIIVKSKVFKTKFEQTLF
jgi:hypothetical protein